MYEVIGSMGLGLFHHRVETDKHGNDVSLIEMPDGDRYRMVHHTQETSGKQRATIYNKSRKFIPVEYALLYGDLSEETIRVGPNHLVVEFRGHHRVVKTVSVEDNVYLEEVIWQMANMPVVHIGRVGLFVLNVLLRSGESIWQVKS